MSPPTPSARLCRSARVLVAGFIVLTAGSAHGAPSQAPGDGRDAPEQTAATTIEITLDRATAWRSRSKPGRIRAEGTFRAEGDAWDAIDTIVTVRDGQDLEESSAFTSCLVSRSGRIRCENEDRTARLRYIPDGAIPGLYRFKLDYRRRDITQPQMAPLEIEFSFDGSTGGAKNEPCDALRAKLVCKGESTPAEPPTKLVFVTSQIYSATFGATNGALDGDVLCQQHADAAGLDGTFMAWLADSTTSPATRFVQSTNPYVLVDGTVIADDWAALTNTDNVPLQNPIDLDEFGAAPPPSVGTAPPVDSTVFWSWVAADGTSWSSGPACGDWGVMIGGFPFSSLGNWTRTDRSWSTSFFGGSFTICEGQAPLVCFEQ